MAECNVYPLKMIQNYLNELRSAGVTVQLPKKTAAVV